MHICVMYLYLKIWKTTQCYIHTYVCFSSFFKSISNFKIKFAISTMLAHDTNVTLSFGTHSKSSRRLLHAALCGLLHSSPGARCGHTGQRWHAAGHVGLHCQNWRFQEKPAKKNAFQTLWRIPQRQRYTFFSSDEVSSSHIRTMKIRIFISFI